MSDQNGTAQQPPPMPGFDAEAAVNDLRKRMADAIANMGSRIDVVVDGFQQHDKAMTETIIPAIRNFAERVKAETEKVAADAPAAEQAFVDWVRQEIEALHVKADKALRGGFG